MVLNMDVYKIAVIQIKFSLVISVLIAQAPIFSSQFDFLCDKPFVRK